MAAWPGVGKPYFALDLAHRVISGLDTPDGSAFDRGTGKVIYVDVEDFLPTIYARTKLGGWMGTSSIPCVGRPAICSIWARPSEKYRPGVDYAG